MTQYLSRLFYSTPDTSTSNLVRTSDFCLPNFRQTSARPTSREDRRVNASPEELNRGWVGKLLHPARLRPNLAISASNCGALSGMFGSRDGRKNKKKAK